MFLKNYHIIRDNQNYSLKIGKYIIFEKLRNVPIILSIKLELQYKNQFNIKIYSISI